MRALIALLPAASLLGGCGALSALFGGGSGTSGAAAVPPPAPGFPTGYRRWPTADAVPDENAGTIHRLYRAPDVAPDKRGRFGEGAVLIKEHVVPGEDDLVVRIDVRRRDAAAPGGWTYETYDAATRARVEIDTEACDLCHQAAPADGTFTVFPGR